MFISRQFLFPGTDAEASRLSNETHNLNTPPIITKLYQMLHTSGLNQTVQNFNYSIHSFNFHDVLVQNWNETLISARDMGEEDNRNRKRRVVSVRDVTTPSQLVMERRRKPGETGSSAPLLNYIFDTYSNTHQHHRNDK